MIFKALIYSSVFVLGSFTCDCDCDCDPPLSDLYEIVQDFPTVNFCNRTFVSKWSLDIGNVRKVTFKGSLNDCETARELCDCFYHLINQKDWLKGVERKCYHDLCDDSVTLAFSGQPDPTYDPSAKVTSYSQPLKKLKIIAEQFKDNTQLFGLRCRMDWREDKCGCLHVTVECPLKCKCEAEGLCKKVVDYFDQKNKNGCGMLENSTAYCKPRGNTLQVEFIGNREEGVDCKDEESTKVENCVKVERKSFRKSFTTWIVPTTKITTWKINKKFL